MEPGVGRLIVNNDWGALRTAFIITERYVLTAEHCVMNVGDEEPPLWLWLPRRAELDDGSAEQGGRRHERHLRVPVHVVGRDVALDVAVLEVDYERPCEPRMSAGELSAYLDGVALPLGTEFGQGDRVRVDGFPESSRIRAGKSFVGKIDHPGQDVDGAPRLALSSPQFIAVSPDTPRGYSGGPVVRTATGDGRTVGRTVVGVFCGYEGGVDEKIPVGGVVYAARMPELIRRFPPVDEAWKRLRRPLPRPLMAYLNAACHNADADQVPYRQWLPAHYLEELDENHRSLNRIYVPQPVGRRPRKSTEPGGRRREAVSGVPDPSLMEARCDDSAAQSVPDVPRGTLRGDGALPTPSTLRTDDLVSAGGRHLLLIGSAGCGKSTYLRYLEGSLRRRWWAFGAGPEAGPTMWAERGQADDARGETRLLPPYVPVLVPAKVLAAEGGDLPMALHASVARHVGAWLAEDLFTRPPAAGRRWLVLVDAVDEVTDWTARRHLLDMIVDAIRSDDARYRFVVCGRPLRGDYGDFHDSQNVDVYNLERFEPEDVQKFAENWFREEDSQAAEDDRPTVSGGFLKYLDFRTFLDRLGVLIPAVSPRLPPQPARVSSGPGWCRLFGGAGRCRLPRIIAHHRLVPHGVLYLTAAGFLFSCCGMSCFEFRPGRAAGRPR